MLMCVMFCVFNVFVSGEGQPSVLQSIINSLDQFIFYICELEN